MQEHLTQDPLIEAARRLERGDRFALVTIAKTEGSTPRKAGARMLVLADGSTLGTVGGAAVELLAIEKAKECLRTGAVERLELNLNDLEASETGMICGGRVELLIEPFGTGAKLHLFGAGHVAYPTARLAQELGFSVSIYDERPEWAAAERFPNCSLNIGRCEETAENLLTKDSDLLLIMTHCHADDYKILIRLLRKPFQYLGIIGSRKKGVEIRKFLERDGFTAGEISRMTCPIGLSIGSHTPFEIAVSVAAQLVQVRNAAKT